MSAENLLTHRPLSGKPDLNLHTLSHFLDRFVYRNPKLSHMGLRGSSIMQPMATENTHAVLLGADKANKIAAPVNSEQFRTKASSEVAVEDVFFHQYFSSIKKTAAPMSAKEKKRAEKKKSRDVDDEEEDDADEDEIWKAMMQSAPDLEGDEFVDDDDDDDLDLADMESDDEMADDADDGSVDIDPAFFDDDDDEDLMDVDATGIPLPATAADVDEIPSDVDDFAGFDSEAETTKKQKTSKRAADKAEKKRKKNLPTFASAEDYAQMLEDDEDEDR
jgi:ribosome biogenesis protein MAK21